MEKAHVSRIIAAPIYLFAYNFETLAFPVENEVRVTLLPLTTSEGTPASWEATFDEARLDASIVTIGIITNGVFFAGLAAKLEGPTHTASAEAAGRDGGRPRSTAPPGSTPRSPPPRRGTRLRAHAGLASGHPRYDDAGRRPRRPGWRRARHPILRRTAARAAYQSLGSRNGITSSNEGTVASQIQPRARSNTRICSVAVSRSEGWPDPAALVTAVTAA